MNHAIIIVNLIIAVIGVCSLHLRVISIANRLDLFIDDKGCGRL